MAATLEDLKKYVGSEEVEYDDLLATALVDAALLVNAHVGSQVAAVPEAILDRCYLIVAADLFERRNAPNGIANQQYATVDGVGMAPMRVARDPLAGVYHLLRKWVTPW